jgi:hypothetical protein
VCAQDARSAQDERTQLSDHGKHENVTAIMEVSERHERLVTVLTAVHADSDLIQRDQLRVT